MSDHENGEAKDPINVAIAATEAPPAVPMMQVDVTISSTGRPASALLPVGCTDAELAEFAGWLLSTVLQGLRQQRAAAANPAGLEVVRGMPAGLRRGLS